MCKDCLIKEVMEAIATELFSINKAIGKAQENPEFIDEEAEFECAKRRLMVFLKNQALDEDNPEW
jgi:hypothetical protein